MVRSTLNREQIEKRRKLLRKWVARSGRTQKQVAATTGYTKGILSKHLRPLNPSIEATLPTKSGILQLYPNFIHPVSGMGIDDVLVLFDREPRTLEEKRKQGDPITHQDFFASQALIYLNQNIPPQTLGELCFLLMEGWTHEDFHLFLKEAIANIDGNQ